MPTQPSTPLQKGPSPGTPTEQRRLPVVWLGLGALVLVAAVIAIVVSTHSDSKKTAVVATGNRTANGVALKETQPVAVTGPALPTFGEGTDQAVGRTAPELAGSSFDGKSVTVAHDGRPKLVLFVAHWCPHCQREVPLLVEYLSGHPLPAGIDLLAVATSTSYNQPNYPPSAWLAREHWSSKVMADSSDFAAAKAFGLPAFPYFVALDSHSKVVGRTSGEISTEDFAKLVTKAMKS